MLGRTPSKEEWDEWLQHPATKHLRAWAEKERLDLMEQWASGNFSAAFTTEMAVRNAGATGACSIYEMVKDLDYNQIIEGAVDEQVRTDPGGASGTG